MKTDLLPVVRAIRGGSSLFMSEHNISEIISNEVMIDVRFKKGHGRGGGGGGGGHFLMGTFSIKTELLKK